MASTNTLTAALQALAQAGPSVLGPLVQHLNGSSLTADTVDALLTQAELNPDQAGTIAVQIAGIAGVPKGVLAYVRELPTLAKDPTVNTTGSPAHVAYMQAITEAQAALDALASQTTLGSMLGKLLLPA